MNRREFTAGCALLVATSGVAAAGAGHVDYTPKAYADALATGKPFMLDFFAPW